MAYNPLNPNGQASMAGSQPVVIASNQTPVSVTGTVNLGNQTGSVIAFPTGNQSVSGTVGASLIGVSPVSQASTWIASVFGTVSVLGTVPVTQSTTPWVITGSVQGSFSPSGNQSVSGTVGASVIGNVNTTITSVATVGGFLNVNLVGGSILTSSTANQSVSGTVGASIIGTVPVVQSGVVISSISGNVLTSPGADTIPATSSILVGVTANTNGSVITTTGYQMAMLQVTSGPGASITAALNFEGTADGTQFVPIQGYNISTNTISSVTIAESDWAFNIAGLQGLRTRVSNWTVGSITARVTLSPEDARPIAAIVWPQGVQSVAGTVGSSIVGQLPAGTAMLGSVTAYQGAIPWAIAGSVAATVTNTNLNVSGSVVAFQGTSPWVVNFQNSSIFAVQVGTNVTSLVSTIPSSVIVGASIFGQLPAGTAMLGSIAAYQGAVPWAMAGSVVAFQGTAPWVIQSIVGTYSEDQASTSADKGILSFGVRNDTVASLVNADLDYGAWSQDSAGRHLIKPFVSEDGTIISYVGSIVSGSVTLIQASAIGKRNYITDFILSNTGAATTLLTFQGGDTSLVGQYVVPTGGGMVATGFNIPLKTTASQDLVFKSSVMTSILYLTVKGYQAP